MPALDRCHPQVVRALEKAGWNVAPKPYRLPLVGRPPLSIDIEAKNANNRIIIVEVKCFTDNEVNDLYTAVGQYLVYRSLLRAQNINHSLYLAIPLPIYQGVFKEIGIFVMQETGIKLIVVDIENEVIVQWLT